MTDKDYFEYIQDIKLKGVDKYLKKINKKIQKRAKQGENNLYILCDILNWQFGELYIPKKYFNMIKEETDFYERLNNGGFQIRYGSYSVSIYWKKDKKKI